MAVAKFLLVALLGAVVVAAADVPPLLEEDIAGFVQRQEVEVALPYFGGSVSVGARNLNEEEIDVKLKLGGGGEARKSKLKKIFAPLLVLVILKAITLIPLALGILGLKTWNAIQLSFVTFVISISLAVFELCKKIAADHAHPVVTHSAGWGHKRSLDEEHAANMAYSAYLQ